MNDASAILQVIILGVTGWTLLEVIGMKATIATLNQWKTDQEKLCEERHAKKS
jgi:hypothetical protein